MKYKPLESDVWQGPNLSQTSDFKRKILNNFLSLASINAEQSI